MSAEAFSDERAREVARVVLTRTLRIQPEETVTIEAWENTRDWANAFVLEARRLRARPLLLYNEEATYWRSIEIAGAARVGEVGRHEWALLEKTDAYVNFWGPSDIVREARLSSADQAAASAYEDRWYEIANRVGVRMARMYLGRVSEVSARLFGVNAEEWRRELVEASLVDPLSMHRTGLKVAERLRKGRSLEIRHSNGTEIVLKLRHREPRVESGVLPMRPKGSPRIRGHPGLLDVNLPAGVVSVAVDETSAEGTFVANESTENLRGVASGGRWELRNGRLVDYSYRKGGEEFERAYRAAGTPLGTPGVFCLGLNPKITRAPWMKDQRLGTAGFSIGGNRFWGGETEGHGFHPFLLLSEAEVRVDGRLLAQPVT